MSRNILMISKGKTFMVGAIVSNLEKEGITVTKCQPAVDELSKAAEMDIDIYLFYLGNFLEDIPETLTYLKDLCTEREKTLCVIGEKSEYEILDRHPIGRIVAGRYDRPLDIPGMVGDLEKLFAKNEEQGARKRILVVDDDAAFLKMVKDWLSEEYHVTIVTSGMQAITFLATNSPDLILLDYEMPVTDGPKVLEMIRSESASSRLPVIFLTGKGDRESVQKVLSLKPDGYLLKSIGKQQLLKSVHEFFEKKKAGI